MRRVQVAVVGAGPVGLALAGLLAARGVSVAVLERREGLHRLPQAHVVTTRTMEILRELGAEQDIYVAAPPLTRMRAISWCETIGGREFGRLSLLGSDPAAALALMAASPAQPVNLAQSRLEPILLDRATALGAEVRFGHQVDALADTGNGVRVEGSSPDGRFCLTADYAVCCDGAGSRTRGAIGATMVGPPSIQTFVTIYFTADLERLLAGRPGPVHWVMGPDVRGVLIGFDIGRSWALMMPYAAPTTPADFTPEVAAELLRRAIGDDRVTPTIDAVSDWNMSAQVADRFQRGRIFLAGDAAHRFPPSGGLGLNTGVHDAHNLAWKLVAVLDGSAAPALLDSYEMERRPVAERNCAKSVENAMRLAAVDMALGASALIPVDPSSAMRPPSASPNLGIDGDAPEAVAKRAAVAAAIAAQWEHFQSAGLDLGSCYTAGAHAGSAPPTASVEASRYVPEWRAGGRLPHVWLVRNGRRVAVHDLCARDRLTLFAPGGGAHAQAAEALTAAGAIRLKLVATGPEDAALYGPHGAAALLVRPDHYVAWVAPDPAAPDLAAAVAMITGAAPARQAN